MSATQKPVSDRRASGLRTTDQESFSDARLSSHVGIRDGCRVPRMLHPPRIQDPSISAAKPVTGIPPPPRDIGLPVAWSSVISLSLSLALVGDSWKMFLIVCTVTCTPKAEIFINWHLLPPCPAGFRDTCGPSVAPSWVLIPCQLTSCLVLVFWPSEKIHRGCREISKVDRLQFRNVLPSVSSLSKPCPPRL